MPEELLAQMGKTVGEFTVEGLNDQRRIKRQPVCCYPMGAVLFVNE